MSDVPEGRLVVEIRHCCTYLPEGDLWVPAPGQYIEEVVPLPVNVDIPMVSGVAEVGGLLTCTMGNWEGEIALEYEYRWSSDGLLNGGVGPEYVAVEGDVGKSVTCQVTATNAGGATTAPPSNAVVITAAGGGVMSTSSPVNQARARREAAMPSPAPVAESV